MDTYGKRLEAALLAKAPKDRAWLASKIGISVHALSQVIIGKTKALTAENHELAIRALGCSGYWLATGNEFISAAKDNELWEKAKRVVITPIAGTTFAVLLEWMKAEAMRRLGLA